MLRLSTLLIWLTCFALQGCKSPPDPISTSERQTFGFDAVAQVVTLGPGDIVSVRVMGHPELSTLENGAQVDRAGNLHLPMVDRIAVQGLELSAVKAELEKSYGEYLRNADVSVDLLENHSNRYYVLGHVQAPGAKPLDRTMTAIEAATAGGYFLRGADRRHIFVLRPHPDGLETHEFDLAQPGPSGMVQVRAGDVIFVRQTGVDNFQEDWLPILSSLGITALSLSQGGVID